MKISNDSAINLVIVFLGAALMVFLAGVCVVIAVKQTPPTQLWATGGAITGALVGVLMPSPNEGSASAASAKAADTTHAAAVAGAADGAAAARAAGGAECRHASRRLCASRAGSNPFDQRTHHPRPWALGGGRDRRLHREAGGATPGRQPLSGRPEGAAGGRCPQQSRAGPARRSAGGGGRQHGSGKGADQAAGPAVGGSGRGGRDR